MTVENEHSFNLLTQKVIAEYNKGNQDAWGNEEQGLLEQAITRFSGKKCSILDAACGDGRLFKYQTGFAKITAVDFNETMLERAREIARQLEILDKVDFVNQSLKELSIPQVDVILASHFLQHMTRKDARIIFQKFKETLKIGGLIIILTVFSPHKTDRYKKSYFDGENRIEKDITEEEFNLIAEAISANKFSSDAAEKPTMSISLGTFSELLYDNGFRILQFETFHVMKNGEAKDVCVLAERIE